MGLKTKLCLLLTHPYKKKEKKKKLRAMYLNYNQPANPYRVLGRQFKKPPLLLSVRHWYTPADVGLTYTMRAVLPVEGRKARESGKSSLSFCCWDNKTSVSPMLLTL